MELANLTSKYRGKLIIKAFKNFLEPGDKVLDVGCGNGVVSRQLQEHFKLDLTGCDVMDYLKEDIVFVKMESADKLPFPNNSFDSVIFNDVLHHTPFSTQEKLIKEALRVADKVLIFELKPTFMGKVLDWFLNKIHNRKMKIPFTYRNRVGWEQIFKKNGVKVASKEVKSASLYPFSHIAFCLER